MFNFRPVAQLDSTWAYEFESQCSMSKKQKKKKKENYCEIVAIEGLVENLKHETG